MKPKVSIIIINWNGWEDTLECLESIYKINYTNYDVVLVDNGSEDDSLNKIYRYAGAESDSIKNNQDDLRIFEYVNPDEALDDDYNNLNPNQRMILIKNDYNSGFSTGNNIGIKFSLKNLSPDYILLLNNDTVVQENFLDELVLSAQKDPEIGIAGPGVYYYDRPDKLAYIGGNIDLCNARISDPDTFDGKTDIDYVVGCGLLIKTIVIEEIGLLDPGYFLYYEDADWCLRAKKRGYRIVYVPESRIWHKISDEKRSLASYYYGNRNSFRIVKKNSDRKFICFLKMLVYKTILSLHLIITGQRKEGFIVIKAVYDGITENYGRKEL